MPNSRFSSFSEEELLYILNAMYASTLYSPVRENLIDEIRTEYSKKA